MRIPCRLQLMFFRPPTPSQIREPTFHSTLPANSLSVLRLAASGLNDYTNLLLQLPSSITNNVTVASTVYGEQSGNWINLTTNTNHAITSSSSNTNVAVVDIYGKVTGVGIGTASITASYPALGLSATQTVQVVYLPATLTHRYSMNETSGTNVADSVGGPAWNGTFPNGGSFGGGQLAFSSASQQYLNLPGGILSNYLATTIDMWIPGISGSTTSPPFVYLFAFGDTDSSGDGYNYIFFNPNVARATISAADPGFDGEQGGDLPSLGTVTNLHLTCVFDCPAGSISVYTNGVLAAAFTGITDSLSTVGNEFAYVGRSLYTADAYLNWTLQELRYLQRGAVGGSNRGQRRIGAKPIVEQRQSCFQCATNEWRQPGRVVATCLSGVHAHVPDESRDRRLVSCDIRVPQNC